MTFRFKQKTQDFYVNENLPFELKGEGDAFYVYFEKRNITTYEVIDHLRRRYKISRKTLGIAGLKDKRAIAKQWISIYDRALNELGGEKEFVNALSEIVKVIKTDRHPFPLNLSTPITNSFHIKLRSTKKLGQTEKAKAIDTVETLLDEGYPNLFGEQRFGVAGRNIAQGVEIMNGKSKSKFNKTESIFKLQAYASKVFNDYVEIRSETGTHVIYGDIVSRPGESSMHYGIYDTETDQVNECYIKTENKDFFFVPEFMGNSLTYDANTMIVTGPVPGFNTPIAPVKLIEDKGELDFLAEYNFVAKGMGKYKDYLVYGLRRPMWVYPSGSKVVYDGDDLVVDFILPAGSYASILVDLLLEALA